MVCGVWCVKCNVWSVVYFDMLCQMRCLECDVWSSCMVCGV